MANACKSATHPAMHTPVQPTLNAQKIAQQSSAPANRATAPETEGIANAKSAKKDGTLPVLESAGNAKTTVGHP